MREKPLKELLAELAKSEHSTVASRNRIAFGKIVDEVREELANNWPVKQIWRALYMDRRIDFSYQTFLKYVSVYITKPRESQQRIAMPLKRESNTSKKGKLEKSSSVQTGTTWDALRNKKQQDDIKNAVIFGKSEIDETDLF